MPTLPSFSCEDAGFGSLQDKARHTEGREGIAARALRTYHFIIDFMEMNLTDFLHNIFILKRDKAKPYRKKENKKKQKQNRGGGEFGSSQPHVCL